MARINVLHAKEAPYYPMSAALILQDGDILHVQTETQTFLFKAMNGQLVYVSTITVLPPDAPDSAS